MTQEDLNALKVELAQQELKRNITELIYRQEQVLYFKDVLTKLSKKKTLSEDETLAKTRLESNINSYKDGAEEYETRIEILRSLISTYSENGTVKL